MISVCSVLLVRRVLALVRQPLPPRYRHPRCLQVRDRALQCARYLPHHMGRRHVHPLVSTLVPFRHLSVLTEYAISSIASLRRNIGLMALFFFLTITFILLAASTCRPMPCCRAMTNRVPQASSSEATRSARRAARSASSPPSSHTTSASPSSSSATRAGSLSRSAPSPSAWIECLCFVLGLVIFGRVSGAVAYHDPQIPCLVACCRFVIPSMSRSPSCAACLITTVSDPGYNVRLLSPSDLLVRFDLKRRVIHTRYPALAFLCPHRSRSLGQSRTLAASPRIISFPATQ